MYNVAKRLRCSVGFLRIYAKCSDERIARIVSVFGEFVKL